MDWTWAKQTRLGRRDTKYPIGEYFRHSCRLERYPKIPVGLNFQLAFPLGMRTMSKRLIPPRESSIDSDEIDEAPNGVMYNGIGGYPR